MRKYRNHKRVDNLGKMPKLMLTTMVLALCHDAKAQNLNRPPVDPEEITQNTPPAVHNQSPRTIGLGNFQANVNIRVDAPAPREHEPLPTKHPTKPAQLEKTATSIQMAPNVQKRDELSIIPHLPTGLKITKPLTDLETHTPPIRREREVFARSFEEPRVSLGADEPSKANNLSSDLPLKETPSSNIKKPEAKKPEAEKSRLAANEPKKEDSAQSPKPSEKPATTLASKEAAKTPEKPEEAASPQTKNENTTSDPERVVYVVDQDLRQFLTDFSRRFGMRVDIAQSVRCRLTKVKLPVDPTALLKELERRFDLEWMIEGDLLKVTARSDLATRIIPLGPLSYEEVIRELKVIDIDTTRYPLRKLSESNSLITTAPTGHIGRIMAMIEALRARKSVGPDLRIVKFGSSQKVTWD